MIQDVFVVLIFLAAIAYVGRLIYRNFQAKPGCASGCGKCGVDFSSIEQQIAKNNTKPTL